MFKRKQPEQPPARTASMAHRDPWWKRWLRFGRQPQSSEPHTSISGLDSQAQDSYLSGTHDARAEGDRDSDVAPLEPARAKGQTAKAEPATSDEGPPNTTTNPAASGMDAHELAHALEVIDREFNASVGARAVMRELTLVHAALRAQGLDALQTLPTDIMAAAMSHLEMMSVKGGHILLMLHDEMSRRVCQPLSEEQLIAQAQSTLRNVYTQYTGEQPSQVRRRPRRNLAEPVDDSTPDIPSEWAMTAPAALEPAMRTGVLGEISSTPGESHVEPAPAPRLDTIRLAFDPSQLDLDEITAVTGSDDRRLPHKASNSSTKAAPPAPRPAVGAPLHAGADLADMLELPSADPLQQASPSLPRQGQAQAPTPAAMISPAHLDVDLSFLDSQAQIEERQGLRRP